MSDSKLYIEVCSKDGSSWYSMTDLNKFITFLCTEEDSIPRLKNSFTNLMDPGVS